MIWQWPTRNPRLLWPLCTSSLDFPFIDIWIVHFCKKIINSVFVRLIHLNSANKVEVEVEVAFISSRRDCRLLQPRQVLLILMQKGTFYPYTCLLIYVRVRERRQRQPWFLKCDNGMHYSSFRVAYNIVVSPVREEISYLFTTTCSYKYV